MEKCEISNTCDCFHNQSDHSKSGVRIKSNKLANAIAPLMLTASLAVSAQMVTEARFSGQAIERSGTGSILFDQTGTPDGNGITNQNFEAALDAFDSFAADDFVVDGDGWSINQLDTVGAQGTGGVANSVNIFFHEDMGGAPNPAAIMGCEYTNTAITAQVAGSFNIVLPTPCDLSPGIYWLVMQTNQSSNSDGQHFWSTSATVTGAEAHWLNPEDGFGRGCTTWSPAWTVCNVGSESASDLLFSLSGSLTHTIGGTVSGLTGTGLTLQNNGGDDLLITADGSFTFNTALADLSDYAVTVSTQPNTPTQSCTVSNGSGQINGANISGVAVDCETPEPQLTLSSTTIDFGAVNVNTTESIIITATNTGNTGLEFIATTAPSAPFTLIGNDSCFSLTIPLAPTETCEIQMTFSPMTIGNFDDVISITTNAATSPDEITISGSGVSGIPVSVPVLSKLNLLLMSLLLMWVVIIHRRHLN